MRTGGREALAQQVHVDSNCHHPLLQHEKAPILVLRKSAGNPHSLMTAAMDGTCHLWDQRDPKQPSGSFGSGL